MIGPNLWNINLLIFVEQTNKYRLNSILQTPVLIESEGYDSKFTFLCI